MKSTRYLFCYGTLLRETAPQSMAAMCRRLPRLCSASVSGFLHDLGSYPGLVLGVGGRDAGGGNGTDDDEAGDIRGEIVAVQSASDWLRLDSYEGCDHAHPERSLFNRVRTTATSDAGEKIECWVYVYNRDLKHAPRIESGCWRTYRAAGDEEYIAIPC